MQKFSDKHLYFEIFIKHFISFYRDIFLQRGVLGVCNANFCKIIRNIWGKNQFFLNITVILVAMAFPFIRYFMRNSVFCPILCQVLRNCAFFKYSFYSCHCVLLGFLHKKMSRYKRFKCYNVNVCITRTNLVFKW